MDRRPFPPVPRRRGPLAVLPENDRPGMVSAFLEVLHNTLPLGLCAVNGRGYPEQSLLIIHNWHPALVGNPRTHLFVFRLLVSLSSEHRYARCYSKVKDNQILRPREDEGDPAPGFHSRILDQQPSRTSPLLD